MKKILFAAIVVVMASGCHDYKADVDKLQQEKTALSSSLEYKDSTITDFLSSFNEIENNLAAIDKKQTLVAESASNGELKSTQKQRILENIQAINDLMSENKKKKSWLCQQVWRNQTSKSPASRLWLRNWIFRLKKRQTNGWLEQSTCWDEYKSWKVEHWCSYSHCG